jgi:hypothetical protein
LHNHLADFWGLRFKYYHEKFPNKIIDLTEVGNSNVQNRIPFTRDSHAREFTEYLAECFKYPYLNSASFFIMSSPDPTWDGFSWRNESGEIYPITRAVRDMSRPNWTQIRPAAPAQPAPAQPQPAVVAVTGAAVAVAATSAPATTDIINQLQQQRAQLQTQLQQAQVQNSQLQTQLQQLQLQNVQLQMQLQQLQAQRATVVTARPVTATATPVAVVAAVSPAPVVNAVKKPAAPAIQNIMQNLSRNPAMPLSSRLLNQIDRIIIHHTAVAPTVGAERIAAYLVNNQGRPGITYHYFITGDGTVQQTNDLSTVTIQSAAQYNPVAVGVGFAGDFTTTPPAPAQLDNGARLIAWLLQRLNLSPQAIFGHKELSSTQSPGAQWDSGAMWGNQLRQRVQLYLNGG